MGSILFKAMMCALAGLAAWAISEPSAPGMYSADWKSFEYRLLLTLGALTGMTLGGVSGYLQGSRVHLIRGVVLGGILGAICAVTGYVFGGALAQAVFGAQTIGTAQPLPVAILARIVALTPIGTCIGFGIGMSTLNWRRGVQGAIGGTFGGLLGGAMFDIVGMMLTPLVLASKGAGPMETVEVGGLSRALTCLLIGFGVGLFIGIVERISRVAWIRLVLGRNEGKEWVVDSPNFVIGRSETANLPLFGDNAVYPAHAYVVRQQGTYFLIDGGNPVGTMLNGMPVQQSPLFHGAQIQIGSYTLQFLMRTGAAPQQAAEALRAQQAYSYAGSGAAAVPQPVPYQGMPQGQPLPTQMPGAQPYAGQPTMMQPAPPQPYPSQPTMMQPMPGQQTVAAPATVVPELVALSGPLIGQRFSVVSLIEAGREAAGISLGFDTMASRRHASFSPSPGGIVVTDLGSTNGTFVNDQRVPGATLRKGDVVRIGVTSFRVE